MRKPVKKSAQYVTSADVVFISLLEVLPKSKTHPKKTTKDHPIREKRKVFLSINPATKEALRAAKRA